MSDGFLPRFEDVEDERQHRKQRLAAAYRIFAKLGFEDGNVGAAGHITVRDPQHTETFWINQYAMPFSQVSASNLVRVDESGTIVEGNAFMINGAAFAVHSQVHAARPDVIAAAHSHSLHGKAFSTLGVPLRPLTQDACAFFDDHAVYDAFSGVVLDLDEGKRIAAALGGRKAAILKNHGLLTVGGSVDAAIGAFVAMDNCCHVQLLAEAAGDPHDIPEDVARATHELVGSQIAMWLTFQPLYAEMVREQPDLLD